MSLKVVIHSASNLPDVDSKGHSDPFVVLSFRGREQKTQYKEDTLNPAWPSEEATFEWPLGPAHLTLDEKLSIKIKDYEKVWFKKLLGQVEIPLREVRENRKVKKRAYDLEDGKHRSIMDATITLEIEYISSDGSADNINKEHEGNGSLEEDGDNDDDEEDEHEGDDDDNDDDDDGGRNGVKRSRRIVDQKRTRRRLARKWSNKTEDFQIRIQIIEGRHLPGSDIYPLVRVTVAGQRRQTSIAQSTNSPIYNKILTFNFRHTSEADLFDEPIFLEVFNARGSFRSNALLSVFKFDIGYVYERKGHSFIRKWIMLSKPEGKEEKDDVNLSNKPKGRGARSAAGYLKVTAVVQGPGDKLPVGIDTPSTDDKDEDIDANCLVPVGVQRRSAWFVLKVYQANDLPQMDTGVLTKFKSFFAKLSSKEDDDASAADLEEETNLVDPYFTFRFSGKEVSTDIKYNCNNPTFSQVLRIPFMFPSMCERLKLQLMDWDQGTKDDYLGTTFLSLSSISGPGGLGEGFLPQFGPCFINFYGSPRECHQMPDKHEHLNKGIGEGVAYRGRVLVELKTELIHGSVARPDRKPLINKDKIHFQTFQKRSNFTLFACFHEATMVAVTDGPVEFELSIGNKGTQFDESVAHSNTTPCKTVPDGSHYYYLPWGREKPCVWIECQWEDIAFRIEPLNILNRMRERLGNVVEDVKRLKDDANGLKQMQSVFEAFSQTCGTTLKHFQDVIPKISGQRNPLDKEIHNLRLAELKNLMTDANNFSNKPENLRRKENVIAEIKNYIKRIRSMAMEPQLSMPDVILWMISGNKRIAYYRMPAHDLMYLNSQNKDASGKLCGKTIELMLKYPGQEGGEGHFQIPALIRLELWLGLAKHQQQWINRETGGLSAEETENGKFNVFAETYENEMKKGKQWNPSTSRNLPHYSDVAGNLKLPKESFVKPHGWEFSGGWIEPTGELSTIRPDENLTEFLDEVYEHETRKYPGGDWEPGKPRYVDSYGNETSLPTDPPTGWSAVLTQDVDDEGQETSTSWSVDLNRAVDDEGWEYSPHRSYWDYGSEEKAYHLNRRRRRIRLRRREPGEQVRDPPSTDGWEYARSLQEDFHLEEKSTDNLRRRRLLHKITSPDKTKEGGMKLPIFKVLVKGKTGKQSAICVLPRMFVTYQRAIKYQLRVSIYQARGLIAQDDTSMNDPYVRVAFMNQSKKTKTLSQTLCPTWDETLIFEEVGIFGNSRALVKNPPSVVMELFDYDQKTDDLLGRCILKPKVWIEGCELPQPKLTWRKVRRGEQDGGQILAECELFKTEGAYLPDPPKKRGEIYCIRDGLRPETKQKAVEILSWGVRDIKNNRPLLVPKPSVEFECNQKILKSDEIISDMKKCPNFSCPVLERKILELPMNDEYAPPLNIRVFDNTWFGKTLVGLHEIKSLRNFEVQTRSVDDHLQDRDDDDDDKKQKKKTDERRKEPADSGQEIQEFEDQELFDWWSKYYASQDEKTKVGAAKDKASSSVDDEEPMTHTEKYLARGYDTLTIYPGKLEDVPQFKGFNDFVTTFPLRKGKTKSTKAGDSTYVGQFKGTFRIFNDPNSYDNSMLRMQLPSQEPVNCIVRVYVIRATQLQPEDSDGLADPYLIVSLGETTKGQPAEHIAKTLNPIFGRMFEFKAKIPLVKDLKIQVMDDDYPDPDDLIGETEIDLEQRLLSSYHATCGMPKTYFKSGPFEWRDTLTPFQLLAKHCTLTGKELRLDKGTPEIINIEEIPYSLNEFETEAPPNPEVGEPLQRLALYVLHKCQLVVPEHVETRPLFNKVQPDIEQGKLEMWVDIFPEEEEEITKQDPSTIGANQTDGTQLFTIVKRPFLSKQGIQQAKKVDKCPVDQLLKAPISIVPRQPTKMPGQNELAKETHFNLYELRVIIWNTADVRLDDKSLAGEQMSDIFVKAWLVGLEKDIQCTSVHERSLDGNGSFNWRMVFPLEYLPIEKKIVIKEKVYLGCDVKMETMPPLLKVQIFDKDSFSGSDLIGDLELNLSKLIRPCLYPSHCGTNKDPRNIADEHPAKKCQFLDLFIKQWNYGWWACYDEMETDNKENITGKVEMTLEILDEEEVEEKPVGRGQSDPNQYPTLKKPIRPAHSFLWYLSPFKTFRYIFWRNYKGFFIKTLIFCLLVLLIAVFVYSIPGYTAKKLLGA